LRSRRR